ncbi:haloacid dehalogenase superfamily, subfamily IA, variant 3 [Anaerolinea thermolimosa]|nr:beta-phosphoglucomutase family hydrolase [Anaerolinea thermolimosa]GAP08215.1 haloacid dehalogenase superfamily, subfamily IA, variant 3 [Anaerolinea thermolimosa]
MHFSAYIFDMDGTLIDNMGFHGAIWSEFLASLGAPVDRETFFRRTVGKVNAEILRDLYRADLSDAEIEELSRRKEQLYRQRFAPLITQKAVPGVREFLQKAHQRGISMAVATSAGLENTRFILDGLGITAYFSALVTSEDVHRGKPDPEIFLIAAQKLGVPPEACLVFEDSPAGLEAAHRAGMVSVALATTFPAEQLAGRPGVLLVTGDYSAIDLTRLIVGT